LFSISDSLEKQETPFLIANSRATELGSIPTLFHLSLFKDSKKEPVPQPISKTKLLLELTKELNNCSLLFKVIFFTN